MSTQPRLDTASAGEIQVSGDLTLHTVSGLIVDGQKAIRWRGKKVVAHPLFCPIFRRATNPTATTKTLRVFRHCHTNQRPSAQFQGWCSAHISSLMAD